MRRLTSQVTLFLLFIPLLFTSAALRAQTSRGILVGVVRDSTGAVVQEATVTIVGDADGYSRTARTKADGSYRFEAINTESYTLTVSLTGFETLSAKRVIVQPSLVTTYDAKLNVGNVASRVEVTADTISINTDNGQLTGVINSSGLAKIPQFGGSPYELATTVPGVQIVDIDNPYNAGMSNGVNIQVNGARARANNWLLDGQEINDVGIGGQAFQPTMPDVFESLAVMTNSASAEYGRAGGGVINAVTKSGTNQFHGQVFEHYQGSGLDANGGLERGSGQPKIRYNSHSYGFNLGGPIIKNKLFAFGGLQLYRYYGSESTAYPMQLPDADGYATLQSIGGPQATLLQQDLSNGDYLNSFIDMTDVFGPDSKGSINVGPLNNCPAAGCTISTAWYMRPAAPMMNPDTQWLVRVDYHHSDKDQFMVRYFHDRQSYSPDFFANPSALPGFDTYQGGPGELTAAQWTHIFSPNLVNEFRVAETRLNFMFAPTAETLANPQYFAPTLFIREFSDAYGSPVNLGTNNNFPQGRAEDLYQFQDTVGWTRGKQSFRIGFDVGRLIEKDVVSINWNGTLTYSGSGTNPNTGVACSNGLCNFLQDQAGASGNIQKAFGKTRMDPHGWRSGLFAQDDIKLSSNLSVNLGIRYDYLTNSENSIPFPALDPSNPTAILEATGGVSTNGAPLAAGVVYKIPSDTSMFGPRFGFAYSPHHNGFFGDGKWVIRGGFGMFFDSFFSNIPINAMQASPNLVLARIDGTRSNPLPNAFDRLAAMTPELTLNSSVQSTVKNLRNPLTYQFNLGIERQLPGNVFAAARYIGTLGRGLYANQQYNYFDGMTEERINPDYNSITARGNFAGSSYNGLQFEVTRSMSHGLQISGNYTWSKALDNASEIFTTFSNPGTSYAANLAPGGLWQDWGNSAYDHRHYLSISYVWSPAGLHSSSRLTDAFYGAFTRHWTLSGVETFQSGPYSSFTTAYFDMNGDGNAFNDRPLLSNRSAPLDTAGIDGDLVGGDSGVYYDMAAVNDTGDLNPVNAADVHWLIPYMPDNAYLHQEIGRNSFHNPGLQYHNVALEKGIGMSYFHWEGAQLILRAEVQNIGNHNNIGPLDSFVTDIHMGFLDKQQAIEDPGRSLRLWAKLTF
ncbi:MAG: carboxypeptidase regulatory-like domain-containing protein [Acidobacteriaceae bacterium]|nr:carboxypeptidase regulatory-like domain-containing protein [Acidobacteriaceae bacterium]